MTTEQQPQEDGQPSKTARPQDDFVRKEEKSEVSVPGTSREAETKVESASDDRGMSSVRDALGIFVGQNSAGNVEQTSNASVFDVFVVLHNQNMYIYATTTGWVL